MQHISLIVNVLPLFDALSSTTAAQRLNTLNVKESVK